MNLGDTSLGGQFRRFPETTMGLLSQIRKPGSSEFTGGMEELARRYWKPVYCFIRFSWAKSNEDAKDLTQAFFLWLFDGAALAKYTPERGGFRRFLKVLLSRFLGHQKEALDTLKRGGGRKILNLDSEMPSLEAIVADTRDADPQKIFDREWANAVIEAAVERVRDRLQKEGRNKAFRVFESYDMPRTAGRPTYEEIAKDLGMKAADVRYHLSAVRLEVRTEIRSELARLTVDDTELEEEWKELIGT